MVGRPLLFLFAFVLGVFCTPTVDHARAVAAGSCIENDFASRGGGMRSFCRRAERLASLPFGMQFME